MTWYNPLTWFTEKETGPFVWAHFDASNPHAGLCSFTDEKNAPRKSSVCITGIGLEEARRTLMGKVIAWERLTEKQFMGLQDNGLKMTTDEIKSLFR